jgi:CBS domain-containing protein
MEKVADVLEGKFPQFNTVSPDALVCDALYQMSSENVDHLIVMEDETFLGILTDYEVARKAMIDNRPLRRILVKELINRNVPVTTSDTPLELCMQLMERFSAKHLAVFDNFDFRGVVSAQDLMQFALYKRKEVFEDQIYARHSYPWNY